MKIFKKNQLALLVISLMLITAGYLNYTSTHNLTEQTDSSLDLAKIGDAELVSSNTVEDNNSITNETTSSENTITSNEVAESNTDVSDTSEAKDYFTTSKLERNVMYSQMIERYQEVLESTNAYTEQKAAAQEEINNINEIQNAIMIAENLLTTKGFEENIIFVNGESISVIIGKDELSQDEIAQIQNIVSRELKAEVDNIHISIK